jgi:DNA-binding transcriptional regulator YiaG
MTPTEIRALRHRLGMTVNQFAAALEVAPQTVRRWEMDECHRTSRRPSRHAVMLIERLA